MGLGLVYSGLLEPGDEVLTTEHDHYATHEALRLRGRARCARSRSTTTPRRPRRTHDRRAARRDHAAHEGRRADLGALGHGVKLPVRASSATCAPLRRRRRRARARRRDRAGRTSATSSSPARTSGSAGRAAPAWSGRAAWDRDPAHDPELLDASRRARRRASRPAATTPSSIAGRSRRPSSTSRARARGGRRAHPRPRHAAQGRAGRAADVRLITPRDAAVSAGHRLLRGRRDGPADGGRAPARAPDPGLGDAVRGALRAARHARCTSTRRDVDAAVSSVKALQG